MACRERLGEIEGVLVIHGSNFSNNGDHIWRAIRENKGIKEVYVSLHIETEQEEEKRAAAKEKLNGGAGGDKKIILFNGNVTDLLGSKNRNNSKRRRRKRKKLAQPASRRLRCYARRETAVAWLARLLFLRA